MLPEPVTPRHRTPSLHLHAADDIRYIRKTMEASASFTAVSGWGGIAMGVTALVATLVAANAADERSYLVTWCVEALLGVAIGGGATYWKARQANVNLLKGAARKFALSLFPPVIAGALITLVIYQNDLDFALPSLWLLCYGAGVMTAGAFSARVVPLMGLCFMVLGGVALFASHLADTFMAIGFGGLHILFGSIIAWKYGG